MVSPIFYEYGKYASLVKHIFHIRKKEA